MVSPAMYTPARVSPAGHDGTLANGAPLPGTRYHWGRRDSAAGEVTTNKEACMSKLTRLILGAACVCALFVGVGSASAATPKGYVFTGTATSDPAKPLYQRPGFRFDGNPRLIMCEKFAFEGATTASVTNFNGSTCWSNPQLPPFTITYRRTTTKPWSFEPWPVIQNIWVHVTSLHYCEFDITGKIVPTVQSETATGANWTFSPALNKDSVVVSNVKENCEPLFGIRNGEKGEFFSERGAQLTYTRPIY
jgi:hypothetical protein